MRHNGWPPDRATTVGRARADEYAPLMSRLLSAGGTGSRHNGWPRLGACLAGRPGVYFMPAPLSLSVRQRIFDLAKDGSDASQVSRLLSLPGRSVRRLLAGWRGAALPVNLAPNSPSGGRQLAASRQGVLASCLRLRRDHPGWGAGRLRVELQRLHPPQTVPPRAPCNVGCARPA